MYSLLLEERETLYHFTMADRDVLLLCFGKDKLHLKEQA